mmetsp:Transcript_31389/g.83495  ORF Transcript_31389/g.83495 Transcript_31389/m.83495 type:complete len:200 (-) Transcript_31389:1556-2155(-)
MVLKPHFTRDVVGFVDQVACLLKCLEERIPPFGIQLVVNILHIQLELAKGCRLFHVYLELRQRVQSFWSRKHDAERITNKKFLFRQQRPQTSVFLALVDRFDVDLRLQWHMKLEQQCVSEQYSVAMAQILQFQAPNDLPIQQHMLNRLFAPFQGHALVVVVHDAAHLRKYPDATNDDRASSSAANARQLAPLENVHQAS